MLCEESSSLPLGQCWLQGLRETINVLAALALEGEGQAPKAGAACRSSSGNQCPLVAAEGRAPVCFSQAQPTLSFLGPCWWPGSLGLCPSLH